MEQSTFGSLRAWGRVSVNRGDQNAWDDFQKRYWPHVFQWALTRTCSEQVAEEVAVDVFDRLFLRITNERLPLVAPDESWSFRPYIHQVVNRLCVDYRRHRGRINVIGLTDAVVARLEDTESSRDLGDRLDEREALDRCIELCATRYRDAVKGLRADLQFEPRSFKTFLRVIRDGKRPKDVDVEFGLKPGLASKTAGRFRDRLLALMRTEGPIKIGPDRARSVDPDTILDELVRLYGDPSE